MSLPGDSRRSRQVPLSCKTRHNLSNWRPRNPKSGRNRLHNPRRSRRCHRESIGLSPFIVHKKALKRILGWCVRAQWGLSLYRRWLCRWPTNDSIHWANTCDPQLRARCLSRSWDRLTPVTPLNRLVLVVVPVFYAHTRQSPERASRRFWETSTPGRNSPFLSVVSPRYCAPGHSTGSRRTGYSPRFQNIASYARVNGHCPTGEIVFIVYAVLVPMSISSSRRFCGIYIGKVFVYQALD